MKALCKLLTFLLLFGCMPLAAQENEMVQKMVIVKKDNTEISLLLIDKPCITFGNSNRNNNLNYYPMNISTVDGEIELLTKELKKMSVVKISYTDIKSILAHNTDIFYQCNENAILVDVASGSSDFMICTFDGRVVLSKKIEQGQHTIPLSFLEKGAYLISIDGKTIKIHKK